MEILFITHKYPPSIGGMQRQSAALIEGMAKLAIVHHIIYKNKNSKLLFFFSLFWQIRSRLKANPGICAIHFNDGTIAAFCWWIKRITNLPVTVTYHGLDLVFPNYFYQKYLLARIKSFDGFFAVSQHTAKELTDRGFDNEKVFIIPNGVDHKLGVIPINKGFQKQFEVAHQLCLKNKKILITLGRPVKRKGISWFIKSVLSKLPDEFILIWIGPFNRRRTISERLIDVLPYSVRIQIELLFGMPTDEKALRQIQTVQAINKRVLFTGKVNYQDLWQYLSLADLFVMPNIPIKGDMEGFGLVSLEANLRELPVLASDVQGIKDAVILGKNGWLLPHSDANKWVDIIFKLFEDPMNLKVAGEKAKLHTLKSFSWEKMVNEYFRCFELLIQKQPLPGNLKLVKGI